MENILNPQELECSLGAHIRALRLAKNLDRQTLAARAGVSLSALRHLESGEGATIKTLIRVVRSLDRQAWIDALAPTVSINPLHLVRGKIRQRARRTKKSDD